MVGDKQKVLTLKKEFNNAYDTDELLWLLKGNENMTAKEFVYKEILNIQPENILDVFEYMED